MKTMLFNPYTGTPRHPSDIRSDPTGALIKEPDEPMRPAADPGPMAATVEEAARDVSKCLNERDGQGLDLRHVAMLVHHAQTPTVAAGVFVPSDWQLVPKTCTPEVMNAIAYAIGGGYGSGYRACKAWANALAVAPAAPTAPPAAKCPTCDDNGRIGGPSFGDPGEGGLPCPDCSPALLGEQPISRQQFDVWFSALPWYVRSMWPKPAAENQHAPVAGQCRFTGEPGWNHCSVEHVRMVLAEPSKWPDYDVRLLSVCDPQSAASSEAKRTQLRDALAQALGSTYVCNRVWSAWQHGTMTADDFTPAAECDEVLAELVAAVESIKE